jgi:hypothetical protein
MTNLCFITGLGLLLALVFAWGFKVLPEERWQILAAIPQRKQTADQWQGLNLTFYGVFLATSCTLAVALLLVLLAAVAVPLEMSLAMIAASLAACLPAASLVARLVERRRHTFTVAGAFFVGCLVIPLVVWALNASLGRLHGYCIPLLPALAAVAVCYALGEGVGRLACVSFGCCYGKPVDQCPRLLRGLFAAVAFVFRGKTKKAAYEGDLEGVPLVPIQALTAVWFSAVCLLGLLLFLLGYYRTALAATVAATQVWRWFSEFFRADYRGGGRFSPYQAMALVSIGYAAAFVAWTAPASLVAADLTAATALFANPLALLFLQLLWVTVFLYTGRSQVTSSTISFHVQP